MSWRADANITVWHYQLPLSISWPLTLTPCPHPRTDSHSAACLATHINTGTPCLHLMEYTTQSTHISHSNTATSNSIVCCISLAHTHAHPQTNTLLLSHCTVHYRQMSMCRWLGHAVTDVFSVLTTKKKGNNHLRRVFGFIILAFLFFHSAAKRAAWLSGATEKSTILKIEEMAEDKFAGLYWQFGHNYGKPHWGSFGKCSNAAPSHCKGSLPGSAKTGLMINRSFSAPATLSGE